MVNLAKLKGKGAPPPVEDVPDVIANDTRSQPEVVKTASKPKSPNIPLQLMVPDTEFAAFSEQAGREFGFTKGSKSNLFMKMWTAYKLSLEK